MNHAAILSLISNLYEQIVILQDRVAELEGQQGQNGTPAEAPDFAAK